MVLGLGDRAGGGEEGGVGKGGGLGEGGGILAMSWTAGKIMT